jgi:hypothetical protein
VHRQYVSGLKWVGGGLFTSAYDGSLRLLDAAAGAFTLAFGDPEREYSAMDVAPDGVTVYLGDNTGVVDIVDVRAGTRVHTGLAAHGRKVCHTYVRVVVSLYVCVCV